jgi:hypothetical protein
MAAQPRRVRLLPTVTIVGSQVVARPDGSTALVLTLKEQGPIAFVVTLETIEILRRELTTAVNILNRPVGHA